MFMWQGTPTPHNVEQESDGTPAEQDHLMQFSMVSGETYGNKDQMFAYSINDYGYYLNSFNSNVPAAEIDSIATNAQQIMGKNRTNSQLIENQIANILRSNSETSMMDHPQLIKFLYDELHTLGFKDLEKVDVLKHTSVVRDPITKEALVPFETRPTKSDMMKNLAWETIHQEAQNHLDKKI